MNWIEPCHQSCYESEVIRLFAADDRQAAIVREHFHRRDEFRDVYLPAQQRHRTKWRQRYGSDPAPPSDRRYPEDDYAGRFSGLTSGGAEQIRIRERMIRTGEVALPCLVAARDLAS